MDEPHKVSPVRDVISESWDRCRLNGVRTELRNPPYTPHTEDDGIFLSVVRPILQHLSDQLVGCQAAVFASDSEARVIDRWVTEAQLARRLDKLTLAVGFSRAERDVGTNAIGTSLVLGELTEVVAGEHYAQSLQCLSCVAAPIRDPHDGRMLGAVSVTVMKEDYSPFIVPLVRRATETIHESLVNGATSDERMLLERFLEATRHSHRPVLSMNEQVLIANRAASELLGDTDHDRLWTEVNHAHSMPRPTPAVKLQIGNGRPITALFHPVNDGLRTVGDLVMLRADTATPVPKRKRNAPRFSRNETLHLPLLAGRSVAWSEVVEKAVHYSQTRQRLIISGEAGVGKFSVALAIDQLRAFGEQFILRDAANQNVEGATRWIRRTAAALNGPPATVIIRHLELLDEASAQSVAQLIDAFDETGGVWLAATVTAPSLDGHAPLLDRFPIAIHIPPLRQRTYDIPVLVEHWFGKGSMTSEAVSALSMHRWPGNVRELHELLTALFAESGRRAPLSLGDLPAQYRMRRPRGLTLIEQTQYELIIGALAACHGNRAHAAERVGISRSSLYRKLESFGIDANAFLD